MRVYRRAKAEWLFTEKGVPCCESKEGNLEGASGDEASDPAGDVATSARGAPGAAKAPLWREPLWAGAAGALPAWFLI